MQQITNSVYTIVQYRLSLRVDAGFLKVYCTQLLNLGIAQNLFHSLNGRVIAGIWWLNEFEPRLLRFAL